MDSCPALLRLIFVRRLRYHPWPKGLRSRTAYMKTRFNHNKREGFNLLQSVERWDPLRTFPHQAARKIFIPLRSPVNQCRQHEYTNQNWKSCFPPFWPLCFYPSKPNVQMGCTSEAVLKCSTSFLSGFFLLFLVKTLLHIARLQKGLGNSQAAAEKFVIFRNPQEILFLGRRCRRGVFVLEETPL